MGAASPPQALNRLFSHRAWVRGGLSRTSHRHDTRRSVLARVRHRRRPRRARDRQVGTRGDTGRRPVSGRGRHSHISRAGKHGYPHPRGRAGLRPGGAHAPSPRRRLCAECQQYQVHSFLHSLTTSIPGSRVGWRRLARKSRAHQGCGQTLSHAPRLERTPRWDVPRPRAERSVAGCRSRTRPIRGSHSPPRRAALQSTRTVGSGGCRTPRSPGSRSGACTTGIDPRSHWVPGRRRSARVVFDPGQLVHF